MRLKLIAMGFLLVVSGLLWWQVQKNGELRAINDQYLVAIEAQTDAMNDLAKRNKQTNSLLADTRLQFQATQRQAQDLADDLRNQDDACINSAISDAVVGRVLEFQSSHNKNYPRDSP